MAIYCLELLTTRSADSTWLSQEKEAHRVSHNFEPGEGDEPTLVTRLVERDDASFIKMGPSRRILKYCDVDFYFRILEELASWGTEAALNLLNEHSEETFLLLDEDGSRTLSGSIDECIRNIEARNGKLRNQIDTGNALEKKSAEIQLAG